MVGSIITMLCGVGLIVASMFYLVPTAQKRTTGWTKILDNTGGWIHDNWIWCLMILLAIILIFVVVYIAIAQKNIK